MHACTHLHVYAHISGGNLINVEFNGRSLRGRSQLSTFMKAHTAYARGEGVWDHRTLFPENQHLILITDNVL